MTLHRFFPALLLVAVLPLTTRTWAQQPKVLDDLTAFFLYQKLSGEAVDFDALAGQMQNVHRARVFDRKRVLAAEAATLRAKYEAADLEATYAIGIRTRVRYQMNDERLEAELFAPGKFLTFSPFQQRGGGVGRPHLFLDPRRAAHFERRFSFANAEAARYIPLPRDQARLIDAVARQGAANVAAEVHFKLLDTENAAVESQKMLRAQVTSVRYAPAGGAIANIRAWPLREPIVIAVAAGAAPAVAERATAAAAGTTASGVPPPSAETAEAKKRLDAWTVYFLYGKVAGEPIDFTAIAQTAEAVRRAPQFEKANALAAEVARLEALHAAADPKETYWIRVGGRVHYELEAERFRADLFDPGKFLHFSLPVPHGSALFQSTQRRISFANADAVRHIPVSRDRAAAIDEVHRSGSAPFAAEVELTVVGVGDPTGAVESQNTLRVAVRSIRYEPSQPRPNDVWPLTETITPEPFDPAKDPPVMAFAQFDTLGLKTGVALDDLKKTVEKEFGAVKSIRPSQSDDPRFRVGIGFAPDSCFAFGNKVPAVGAICIRAYADDRAIIRKIVVEQILAGSDWDPTREALLKKYGAISESVRKSNNLYFGWGPLVAKSVTMDDQLAPSRALTASLSAVQSAMDRMAASTRVLTNLRIRLIDPEWAGAPTRPAAPETQALPAKGKAPRL